MGVRLPTILAKGINDVYMTINEEYDEERIVDMVNCVRRLEELMEDLQTNAKLRPIVDDGAGDVALWNKVSDWLLPCLPAVLISTHITGSNGTYARFSSSH
jgi:hypothetical protein